MEEFEKVEVVEFDAQDKSQHLDHRQVDVSDEDLDDVADEDFDDVLDDDALYDDPNDILDDLDDDPGDEAEVVWTGADPATPMVPTPGCAVSFYLDNKRHHAVCLAVIGDELLLEHKGASRCFLFTGKVTQIVPRLRLGVASATIIVGAVKACRYRSVHKKWLREMVKHGQNWKGIERGGGVVPPAADLLQDNGQLELF